MFVDPESKEAAAAMAAVRTGDVETLKDLLSTNPQLSTAHFGTPSEGRTLLHILTDWPGQRPNCRETIQVLMDRGANIDAPFVGAHSETALHWAASNDDVESLDALLDHGANIEARGGVVGDGTPLGDARVFLQLQAARRLIERGAVVTLDTAATLGLLERVEALCEAEPPLNREATDRAFWNACHGGQLPAARFLFARGADPNAVPPWGTTPLDAATASKVQNDELVAWLASKAGAETRENKVTVDGGG